ncbi:MAG: hypothetical protein HC880_09110 [Bacteroidia bacterium]|nr:hypothetical protein [Bacteroidia bacterium]
MKAFNTIFADIMEKDKLRFGSLILSAFYCGNDVEARQIVGRLAEEAGFNPVDAGELKNARYLEGMAHLNIQLAVTMQGGTDAGFGYFRK